MGVLLPLVDMWMMGAESGAARRPGGGWTGLPCLALAQHVGTWVMKHPILNPCSLAVSRSQKGLLLSQDGHVLSCRC
jgi:hypothetical protein